MKIHIVQRGETLWSIAEKYQVSFEEVKKMNAHLANPDMIVPGMKIKLPETSSQLDKSHPYTNNKPYPCPPKLEESEGMREMEELDGEEFVLPEQWMAEPAPMPAPETISPPSFSPPFPVPQDLDHGMMVPEPYFPVPCYYYPVPFPMPYMLPPYMQEAGVGEEAKEALEKMQSPEHMPMLPKCPYCHR